MNYKNDPLFRFLASDLLGEEQTTLGMSGEGAGKGICCLEKGAAQEQQNGIAYGSSLAMVYSPYQRFEELYGEGEALCRGTLFRALDKPFLASGRGL